MILIYVSEKVNEKCWWFFTTGLINELSWKNFIMKSSSGARACTPASSNKVKNALNKSPSLRAEFPKFDQIPDNLRFIEALIGLD